MAQKKNQPSNAAVLETQSSNQKRENSLGLHPEGDQQGKPLQATSGRRYTLDELLAASDYPLVLTKEDREWLDAPPVGRELI
ncbi:hypothetical protein [Alcaligenes faecalis]|uniref:Uncharacterized protein n=1 Tax=Alcaligenes faecalis TaxID=511 RepID=A0AAE9H9N1_ALCFA|nr:hypothetical protein [Alcaligenes faecalis]UPL20171.1 hypothetical protein MXF72_12125 [Alcaligenes faecalis]